MSNSSIFEYLTIENPQVTMPPKGRGNTSDQSYVEPTRLLKWDDFSMDVFKELYGGNLMAEAHRKRPEFHVPFIDEDQCRVDDERATWHLLEHWTLDMTKAALRAVNPILHPSTWSMSTMTNRQPKAQKKNNRKKSEMADYKVKRKDKSRVKIDASTISLCKSCQIHDTQSFWGTMQRLPKEIKVYPKFSAQKIIDRLDPQGYWDPENRNIDEEMPIRQAYTYCIIHGCRYGCILTAFEAFIFRIRPLYQPDGSSHHNPQTHEDAEQISDALWVDGLMEYAIVPWKAHREQDCDTFEELTVNFSLWVLHILAGNAHHVQWDYQPLRDETLVPQPCPPPPLSVQEDVEGGNEETGQADESRPSTSLISPATDTSSRKRPRTYNEDPIALSFHEDFVLDPPSPNLSYLGIENDEDFQQQRGYELYAKAKEKTNRDNLRRSARIADKSTVVTEPKRVRRDTGTKAQTSLDD